MISCLMPDEAFSSEVLMFEGENQPKFVTKKL